MASNRAAWKDYHLLTKKRCEKDLIATEVDELIVKVVNLRKNCPGKIAQSTAAIKKLELHRLTKAKIHLQPSTVSSNIYLSEELLSIEQQNDATKKMKEEQEMLNKGSLSCCCAVVVVYRGGRYDKLGNNELAEYEIGDTSKIRDFLFCPFSFL
ncbi:unnamed protein product [Dracunculus medinensis]|uniref:Glutaredoxin domain-containing protein n=1 Tax=Dracunculus medinensis TaxID=318479 RepID=A0A0N4UA89_DRAME|nr:unnamed protein product [Dracunculus medinensis]